MTRIEITRIAPTASADRRTPNQNGSAGTVTPSLTNMGCCCCCCAVAGEATRRDADRIA
jgi:hypothetical protein